MHGALEGGNVVRLCGCNTTTRAAVDYTNLSDDELFVIARNWEATALCPGVVFS